MAFEGSQHRVRRVFVRYTRSEPVVVKYCRSSVYDVYRGSFIATQSKVPTVALVSLNGRVDSHVRDAFAQMAADQNKSVSELLREVVIDYVGSAGDDPVRDDLTEVRREVRALRASLLTAVAGLLHNLSDASAEEAERWVRTNLLE